VAHGEVERKDGEVSIPEKSHEKPKKRMKAVLRAKAKQITVGRLPKDLVLHINRSIFDEYGDQLKNTAPVKVSSKLNFLSRWCAPLDEDDDTVEAVYELKCIVTHFGRHDNGHYVALGKRGKEWFSFNDEIVTKITEEEALSRGNGFMLFYEAIPFQTQLDFSMDPGSPVPDTVEGHRNAGTELTHDGMEPPDGLSNRSFTLDSPEPTSTTAVSADSSQDSTSVSESGSPIEAPTDECERNEIPLAMRTAGEISSHAQGHHAGTPVVSPL